MNGEIKLTPFPANLPIKAGGLSSWLEVVGLFFGIDLGMPTRLGRRLQGIPFAGTKRTLGSTFILRNPETPGIPVVSWSGPLPFARVAAWTFPWRTGGPVPHAAGGAEHLRLGVRCRGHELLRVHGAHLGARALGPAWRAAECHAAGEVKVEG